MTEAKSPRRCDNCKHYGTPNPAGFAPCSLVTEDWCDTQGEGTPYILPPAGEGLWVQADWSCPGFESREPEPKGTSCWSATVRVEFDGDKWATWLPGWLPVKYRLLIEYCSALLRAGSKEPEVVRVHLETMLRANAPEVTWTVVSEVLPT